MHSPALSILLPDRHAYIMRAHRLRGALMGNLIRDAARWIVGARLGVPLHPPGA